MTRSTKIRALAALGSLAGLAWAGTFATFTDSATASSTFTAGTVDLELADEADDDYGFTAIEMANMKPGDVKYAPLKVENAGTLGFAYSMSVSATNADGKGLASQLVLGAKTVLDAATCDTAGLGYGLSATTVVAEGSLSSRTITNRALASGSEVLCVKVELPAGTGDTFQGATTTATFTFSATQS